MRRIGLSGFTCHEEADLALPEEGVVVVTGPNGAGKSSFIEGVSWATWGETLRGDDPTPEEAKRPTIARVTLAEALEIERRRKGRGKARLRLREGDGEWQEGDTASKTQPLVDARVPTFEAWQRTHVFSQSDAAHFTLAGDAERKRFLERLVGAAQIDAAHQACRADLREAERERQRLEVERQRLAERLDGYRQRLAEVRADLEGAAEEGGGCPVAADEMDAERQRLERTVRESANVAAENERAEREARDAAARAEAAAKEVERRVEAVADGECPTCGQEVEGYALADLERTAEEARAAANDAVAASRRRSTFLREMVAEVREEASAARRRLSELAAEARQAEENARRRAAIEERVARGEEAVDEVEAALKDIEGTVGEVDDRLALIKECDRVLGLRGVRALVLGDALEAVESSANAWLSRIADDVAIRLAPTSKTQRGGESERLNLRVEGIGRGTYASISGGQRRRIDVALLLALGEIAAAARGETPGTLFFDEVFDALDEAGVPRVSEVVAELAEERAVVVITHNRALARSIRSALGSGARRVHVDGSGVAEVEA